MLGCRRELAAGKQRMGDHVVSGAQDEHRAVAIAAVDQERQLVDGNRGDQHALEFAVADDGGDCADERHPRVAHVEGRIPGHALHALAVFQKLRPIALIGDAGGVGADTVKQALAPGAHDGEIGPDEGKCRDLGNGTRRTLHQGLDMAIAGWRQIALPGKLGGEEADVVGDRLQVPVDAGDRRIQALGGGLLEKLVGIFLGHADGDQHHRGNRDGDQPAKSGQQGRGDGKTPVRRFAIRWLGDRQSLPLPLGANLPANRPAEGRHQGRSSGLATNLASLRAAAIYPFIPTRASPSGN